MQRSPVLTERDGEAVSPQLAPLLWAAHDAIVANGSTDISVVPHVRALLRYLASSDGRTNANCWAADLFFCLDDHWAGDWDHLSPDLADILADIGGALHDTVKDPAIAENFGSTPELLLERLQALDGRLGTT